MSALVLVTCAHLTAAAAEMSAENVVDKSVVAAAPPPPNERRQLAHNIPNGVSCSGAMSLNVVYCSNAGAQYLPGGQKCGYNVMDVGQYVDMQLEVVNGINYEDCDTYDDFSKCPEIFQRGVLRTWKQIQIIMACKDSSCNSGGWDEMFDFQEWHPRDGYNSQPPIVGHWTRGLCDNFTLFADNRCGKAAFDPPFNKDMGCGCFELGQDHEVFPEETVSLGHAVFYIAGRPPDQVIPGGSTNAGFGFTLDGKADSGFIQSEGEPCASPGSFIDASGDGTATASMVMVPPPPPPPPSPPPPPPPSPPPPPPPNPPEPIVRPPSPPPSPPPPSPPPSPPPPSPPGPCPRKADDDDPEPSPEDEDDDEPDCVDEDDDDQAATGGEPSSESTSEMAQQLETWTKGLQSRGESGAEAEQDVGFGPVKSRSQQTFGLVGGIIGASMMSFFFALMYAAHRSRIAARAASTPEEEEETVKKAALDAVKYKRYGDESAKEAPPGNVAMPDGVWV